MLVVRSSKPLLVIDGLKLLAVQLKDVGVCATMVRLLSLLMIIARMCFLFHCMIAQVRGGIIQHVRACVDTWEKGKGKGSSSGSDDGCDVVNSASSDGPDDGFFEELCARVCDLLVVICHHACTTATSSVWYVACEDVRSARLRRKPSLERTDDVWVEPAAYVHSNDFFSHEISTTCCLRSY